MDKIFIQNLRIRTTIGVLPHERKYPQLIVISLEIFFSGEAKNSDQISDALDYDAICSETVELVKRTSFRLIERLAEEVAQSIIKKFGAVSKETCLAMVNNLGKIYKTEISVSITGIAGPKGGSKQKPVGLVYIGIRVRKKVVVNKCNFKNKGRIFIQKQTVKKTLNLLSQLIKRDS